MNLDKKSIMALVMLALGLLVAVPQLIPDGEQTVIVEGELFEDEEEPASVARGGGGDETFVPSGPQVDLIARYGSWSPGTAVSDPFGVVERLEELAPASGDDGQPPFPPVHHVSLVLLAGQVPRAVVDQRVVSLGDEILAGRIVEMSAEGLAVTSRIFGRLDYDLGVTGARGYGVTPPLSGMSGDGDSDAEAADAAPGAMDPFAVPRARSFDAEFEGDPDQLAETAERMLQELYTNIGSLPGDEEDGR